jgi:hypothetical protein
LGVVLVSDEIFVRRVSLDVQNDNLRVMSMCEFDALACTSGFVGLHAASLEGGAEHFAAVF